MKNALSVSLQFLVIVLGVAVLGFLLWEPQLEGRNANATQFEIYFNDPFLAFVYIGSIPFFIALYHAYKLLGYYRESMLSSAESIKSLQAIRRCAFAVIGFAAIGEVYIMSAMSDDRAGGIMMGLIVIFGAAAAAIAATVLQKKLQNNLTL